MHARRFRRRDWIQRTLGYGLIASGALALMAGTAHAQPSYTVSAEQLQDMVAHKFPRNVPLAGMVDLTLQAPRLRMLPSVNRLGATMEVEAAGPALRRSHPGSFDVEFALRYEASDRTLRAHQIRLGRLELAGLKPAANELLNAYAPALAEQSLREVVLHQLRPQDTAVFDGLGLEPGPITVTDKGLQVAFVRKPG
jgi:hypothetical protein